LKPGELELARNTAIGKLVEVGEGVVPVKPSSIGTKSVKSISAEPISGRFPSARGRILTGLKSVGASLALLGLGFLAGYLRAKTDEAAIQRQLKALEPKMEAELAKQILHTVNLTSLGQQPWANITVTIVTTSSFVAIGPEAGWIDGIPEVDKNVDVNVTAIKKQGQGAADINSHGLGQLQTRREPYTYSCELKVPAGAIELYRSVVAELEWYQHTVQSPGMNAADAEWLLKERERLLKLVGEHFGLDQPRVEQHFRDIGLL
jgi:hypothetical protein